MDCEVVTDAERIWRVRSDEQLLDAASHISEFTEEGRRVVRAELSRRGLSEPLPSELAGGGEPGLKNPAEPALKNLGQISGWLILPAIGIVFTVLQAAVITFLSLAVPPSESGVHTVAAPVVNAAYLALAVLVAWLFFLKHHWAPRLYVGLLALNMILAGAAFAGSEAGSAAAEQAGRAFLPGVVWIAYFSVSRRVKLTFVKAPDDLGPDRQSGPAAPPS